MKNFELLRTETIEELNTQASIYRHIPTGAEILSMKNDDENKCFGISFRTPPSDSTGVPHILEHTVLCGSEKYPVKDPFVQLLKGALQTFLNAFTYPDKTCYPVASQNLQDFHNLVDVYLDAVFHPRITPDFFMQEGWHFELESPEEPLRYKGVVYNEMKGVYSSADSLLMEYSQQSLFPDTTYGKNSGGDPAVIPELTYEQFKDFHATFYHPSNARIFFYGNDPIEQRFEHLEAYLKEYQKIDPKSDVEIQQAFTSPIELEESFAVSKDDPDPRPMFTMNWVLPSPTNAEKVFTLELLDHILIGTSASPLRKALIESGLGEDITGGGLETHMIQMMYSIGLKGVEEKNLQKAKALILQTFEELVRDGIDSEDIAAALNSFEFDLRENNSGGFPRGLSLWLKSLSAWNYDADPLELVAFEAPLQAVKKKAAEAGFFEQLIQRYFLENTHRSTVTLLPDPEMAARLEAEEEARLQAAREKMDIAQVDQIIEDTKRLMKLQETPDTPEAMATLPLLKREDLDPNIRTVERTEWSLAETTVLAHPLFTNGILYFDFGFDLSGLAQEDLPYVSLLGNLLLEMGTQTKDYVELSQEIATKTGGIYGVPFIAPAEQADLDVTRFFLRTKCMLNQTESLFEILSDILLKPNFDHLERFRQIVLEHKSEMESGLVPRGHMAVMGRLKAHYSPAFRLSENLGGVEGLLFIRRLLDEIDSNWSGVLNRLNRIFSTLLNRSQLVINITVDPSALPQVQETTERFLETLPSKPVDSKADWNFEPLPKEEAITAPTQVNYVGTGCNLYQAGYTLHGSAFVIVRYLQTAWLWEKIRVQGGAYGGVCSFDHRSGTFVFASYRDPNLQSSLDVYQATGDYLENLDLSDDELTRAIIGAIGQLDAYQLPDSKGYSDLGRYLFGFKNNHNVCTMFS